MMRATVRGPPRPTISAIWPYEATCPGGIDATASKTESAISSMTPMTPRYGVKDVTMGTVRFVTFWNVTELCRPPSHGAGVDGVRRVRLGCVQ